jgi:hypothetical protein
MPTTITAQNGARLKQNTRISVSKCHKRKVKRRHKHRHGHRHGPRHRHG